MVEPPLAGRPYSRQGITGKNFRLSEAVRPSRYNVLLRVDPNAGTFSGEGDIAIELSEATSAITLHSIGHTFGPASVQVGNRVVPVTSIERNGKSETVTLHLDEAIEPGRARIKLAWSGKINAGLHGLYKADEAMAITQFEPSDARRAIPSFDEPSFKARWDVAVEAPKDMTVLSNGMALSSTLMGKMRRTTFSTTKPLSTYLVALGVGNFVSSRMTRANETPIRTWTIEGKEHLTKFAQTVGREGIVRLEAYFGRKYAFGKLDQLGVPNFQAGAMENGGLVTYRETALLQDPKTASLNALKRVAGTITHENAHQWFGNLVTMKWWNDLWLNESFATWMSTRIMDGWKPGWRVWLDFNQSRESAFQLDALESTHPIYANVKNANDAKFDAITYEKGAGVLRMLENYVGERNFQRGIRHYIKTYAYKNATADDLWQSVQSASGQPVMEVANAWIKQKGFPLVSVSRDADGQLEVSQSRFFSARGKTAKGTWPIPMVVRYEDDAGVHEQRILFDQQRAKLSLASKGQIKWLTANAGYAGVYRVAYDKELMAGIADNLGKLEPAERIGLLSDSWALMRSGRAAMKDWLALVTRFKNEKDPMVLDEVAAQMGALSRTVLSDADRPAFEATVTKLFAPEMERLGWEKPAIGGKLARESEQTRLRRSVLLSLVGGTARDPRVEAEARARMQRFLAGDPGAVDANLLPQAIRIAARNGEAALFDAYEKRYITEADPVLSRNLLGGLTAFESPELATRAQDMLFDGKVPQQDTSAFVAGLLGNRAARDVFWQRMQQQWPKLSERLKDAPSILERVIQSFAQLAGRKRYQEVQALFEKLPLKGTEQAVKEALEQMRLNLELTERAQPELSAWLSDRTNRASLE